MSQTCEVLRFQSEKLFIKVRKRFQKVRLVCELDKIMKSCWAELAEISSPHRHRIKLNVRNEANNHISTSIVPLSSSLLNLLFPLTPHNIRRSSIQLYFNQPNCLDFNVTSIVFHVPTTTTHWEKLRKSSSRRGKTSWLWDFAPHCTFSNCILSHLSVQADSILHRTVPGSDKDKMEWKTNRKNPSACGFCSLNQPLFYNLVWVEKSGEDDEQRTSVSTLADLSLP